MAWHAILHVAVRPCRRVHRLEIPLDDGQPMLSIGIGLAMRTAGDTRKALVERADQAMCQAKPGGRNCAHVSGRRPTVHGSGHQSQPPATPRAQAAGGERGDS